MGKSTADELVKAISNKKRKNNKDGNMKKINFETVKTVVIFVLVTAIIAFIAGMKYQQKYEKAVEAKAHAIASQQASVKPEVSKQ